MISVAFLEEIFSAKRQVKNTNLSKINHVLYKDRLLISVKKIILVLLLIGFLVVPVIGEGGRLDVEITYPLPDIPFLEGLERITNALFFILMTVAVIFIIIGAFALLTAQGDEDKIKTGRQQILYAVIAVVVAILAWGIVDFIRRVLYPEAG